METTDTLAYCDICHTNAIYSFTCEAGHTHCLCPVHYVARIVMQELVECGGLTEELAESEAEEFIHRLKDQIIGESISQN